MSERTLLEGRESLLPAGRCAACGHVFAPYQTYGCENCGAHGAALEELPVPGLGRLLSWAAIPAARNAAASSQPETVIEVELDGGLRIRTLLQSTVSQTLALGARVAALEGAVAGTGGVAVAVVGERPGTLRFTLLAQDKDAT